jgi:hypothetical protein
MSPIIGKKLRGIESLRPMVVKVTRVKATSEVGGVPQLTERSVL